MTPWFPPLLHAQQLHVEDQSGIGRDRAAWSALGAVAKIGRNAQLAFPANPHSRNSLFPSFDHFPVADRKIERLPGIDGTVELFPRGEPARIVHAHVAAFFCGLAVADP